MSDPSYALQIAMAAALLGDAGVTGLVGQNVFDDLSAPDSAYPRVCIGDDQVIGETNTCFDPSEIYSTVHIWAANSADAADARLKAKQIAAQVRRVLAQTLTLVDHAMTSALFHDSRFMIDGDETDADGRVAHGVLTFHYRTSPTA